MTAGVTTPPRSTVVDVHSHFMPLGLSEVVGSWDDPRWPHVVADGQAGRIMRGADVFRPVTPACWDASARLESIDSDGYDIQVVSPVPVSLTYWAPGDEALAYARVQNDALAELASASSGRIVALGSVPLQDTDLAIGEMQRAFGELGMAGIEIGTTVGSRELDDAELLPFFVAAAELGVPLFVHPIDGGGAVRRSDLLYDFGVGMLADTALAASALVFGGVLDRCPGLKIALSHGCGAFTWMFPRLRFMAGNLLGADGAALDELVSRLWVDTLVFDPAHIPLLIERYGDGHIMLGSDAPFLPTNVTRARDVIDGAHARGTLDEAQRSALLGLNALAFLGV